jgi:hypothetical protein
MKTVNCNVHGAHGLGLVCAHVANGLVCGEKVGFYWSAETDTARPDAWCTACEQALNALGDASTDDWFAAADFKILCALCWDEAKAVCGGFKQ